MTDAPELKPCPFCGVMPEVTNGMISHPYAESKDGACVLAGLGISIVHSKWNIEQITSWNTRADLAKPRVKPLVWRQYSPNGNSEAQTTIGQYVVEDHGLNDWGVWLNDTHDPIIGPFNTLEAAKAAAQADYEARVLACFDPPSRSNIMPSKSKENK